MSTEAPTAGRWTIFVCDHCGEATGRHKDCDNAHRTATEVIAAPPRWTHTVPIADELAERFTEWTRVDSLGADWFRVELHADGTATVLLSQGDEPPA